MKRRSRLKRTTPLRPRKELQRGKGLGRNARRRRKLRRAQFGTEDRGRWLQSHPCVSCGAPATETHHVRSRGAGGGPDDQVPICRECHTHVHAGNPPAGVDLTEAAAAFAARWRELEDTTQ